MTIAGPGGVIRAQVSTAALSRHAAPARGRRSGEFCEAAPLGQRSRRRGRATTFRRIIEDILRLRPRTRQVFMVMGSGEVAKFWHRELEEQFKRFDGRLTFFWSDDLSLPEILRRCGQPAALTRQSSISRSARTRPVPRMPTSRVLADIHAAASAPLFGVQGAYFGHGVVGGMVVPVDDVARNTADVVVRLSERLRRPEASQTAATTAGRPIFDWRELDRWGIPESRLPGRQRRALPGSEPVERIQGDRADRGGRSVRAIAPDRRAPVPAPRTAAGRNREPEEPGARRRRQPPPDDVGADELDCARGRSTPECDDPQRPGAADDDRRQSGDAGDHGEILSDIRTPGPAGHADHRSASDHAPKSSGGQEADRPSRRHQRKPCARRSRPESAADRKQRQSARRLPAPSAAIRCFCSRCS